jgi:4-carboxymuconolactone decarboxylase
LGRGDQMPWQEASMTDDERRGAGEKMRRKVLGDSYVDKRQATATPFSRDLEDVITRFAWGEIWARPGLDPKIRSIIVMVIAATRSQWDEFRAHVRGALNNGATREEIKEVLIQAGAYGGLPVARTGFKEAQAVFTEIDQEVIET